ncbi:NAD(P)/FAD-dependent oxidoreductase [bacterium]|nr:MAG: NAD(P)/FAD-dependent oxidoreductase [bacterium]
MDSLELFKKIPIRTEDELLSLHTPPLTVRQSSLSEADGEEVDVAIVGAGPAGSIAALHLAREGYRVFLADCAGFPRNKTCGDGLIRDSSACLERAGLSKWLEETAYPVNTFSITSRKKRTANGTALTRVVQRKILDAKLAETAIREGAVFARAKVSDIVEGAGGVTLKFQDSTAEIRAGYAIVATGTSHELVRKIGSGERIPPYSAAIRCYVSSSHDYPRMRIVLCGDDIPGYGWVFPMGRGLFNVGIGYTSRSSRSLRINLYSEFERFLGILPEGKELVSAASARSPWLGHPLRCGFQGAPPLLGERILATGETIGTTYPFSGEGIGKAMESAELAAKAVSTALKTGNPGELGLYPKEIDTVLRPKYRGYFIAEKWLASPWRSELFIALAERSTPLRRRIKAILEETANPSAVFSFRGILGSLLRK